MCDCVLCFSPIIKNNDKNLVQSRGQFKVDEEIRSLQFVVQPTSQYICKSCVGKLRKRRALYNNLKQVEEELFEEYSSKALKAGFSVKRKAHGLLEDFEGKPSPEKRISFDESVHSFTAPLTSTPHKTVPKNTVETATVSPVRPVVLERSDENGFACSAKTVVKVSVQWPSKSTPKVNTLDEGLESLGKMLCRGTYGQIAAAAWKNPILRRNLQQLFLKEVDKECSAMCSVKDPSCLRSTKAQDVKNFSFNKVEEELQRRAPLLSSVLWTASLRKSKRDGEDPFWKPSVCMAAATLLKNRSPCMTLLQLINTIIIYHSGMTVSFIFSKNY